MKEKTNIILRRLKSSCYQGFSLIEMAIVLIIIGLIAGSILKGQELIENARLTALVSQILDIRKECTTFEAKYEALPGDFKEASTRIHDSLTDGDGDHIIKGEGFEGEALHFWQHLRQAGLLPTLTPLGNEPDFGKGLPSTKLGGGITITYGAFNTNHHWLVIGKKEGQTGKGALLTPQQALFIDQKLGSGQNNTTVRAAQGEGAQGTCLTGYNYNLANKKPACIIYVDLGL